MSATKLVDWLKKEKIFLESDALGIKKMATIGYLTKLHPHLTSQTHLKPLLIKELSNITIDPTLACKLDLTQKQKQTEAMSNSDMFIPELPDFELYKAHISYGRDNDCFSTDVIGIKCATEIARLLKEFFSQLCNPMELDTHLGVFIPTGAVHQLGAPTYANLICKNNEFIHSVMMIPVGNFQHATLDIPFSTDNTTDINMTMLEEQILKQSWCLRVERSSTENKVPILTTKGQLTVAHK